MRRLFAVGLAGLVLVGVPVMGLAGDAPEISRSAGQQGGVVVLWPRIIPRSSSAVTRNAAWVVQQHLIKLVGEAFPNRPVDVRPEPERVCPQAGCKAMAVGALLVHQNSSCAVVGWASPPGRSSQTLVPWAGLVELKRPTIPFREPVESHVTIRDFQSCDRLAGPLTELAIAMSATIASVGSQAGLQPVEGYRPVPIPVPQPVAPGQTLQPGVPVPIPVPMPQPKPQPETWGGQ